MKVVMGANNANEVAEEKFCSKSKEHGAVLKELMQTTNFRVTVVEEADVEEICGTLKVRALLCSFAQNTFCKKP
ncbi:hypothetical protein AAFF_G00091350 [Aldrovandia affinis]|uniref:Uncharacterized protein n=1 Tax=Aldrovandia affinis TaxID=143900 RepID=A0AAD7R1J0_9TELE|nr:hypothetical protein AAFF_G00091350 [Aldrovandia affinis]